ncbi:MAG: alpha/beta fold hydrolase [Armatimonadota bacterium]|nr:alpha/beta fold hydrolase [Armatimonadota bacterium]MDR7463783.1 alpha/beta fold hydrolase [Armatimonadota bacterium]MDR7469471.1 alpha/beta fold hydrolase [Armatimonadota bacterium]MDR7473823.1 alpha/beta fold hydrolase [Armatimonadota bacterium]MDR7539118.1 alpha/beta fold hydrolase [Armatimonadota bacterium]
MRRVIDGMRLGCDLGGTGPAVLFLHAFPLNRRMWAPQQDALRGQARMLAVDFRGFGESDLSPGPYTLEDLAGDVLGLARSLGVNSAVVVGLSMGGYVAFRLVARAPEFVRALVLADTRAEADTPEGRAGRLALAERAQREGLAALEQLLQGLVGPTTRASRPEVAARLRQIIGDPPAEALAGALRALAGRPDSRPQLPAITAPTLVLVGEEDGLTTPNSARVIAEGIRGARLVLLPRAGHLSNLEAPEAFNRELVAFVREVG